MNQNVGGKIHNIAGIVATIILVAILVGAGVYVYDYFTSFKKDFVANDIKIEVEKQGTGEGAKRGDTVYVNYIGMFEDGTQFDNSYRRDPSGKGQAPLEFTLGDGQVIKGWEEGILGMKVGEKRKLTIPPSLGYGPNDYGPIPGNSTLVFETELVSIESK